jgi:hypothetical protein
MVCLQLNWCPREDLNLYLLRSAVATKRQVEWAIYCLIDEGFYAFWMTFDIARYYCTVDLKKSRSSAGITARVHRVNLKWRWKVQNFCIFGG